MLTPVNNITGRLVKNRYQVENLLGQGGFGAVYKGRDTLLDVPVAIKMLFQNDTPMIRQFELEAKILARLKHPGLPRVTDFFSLNSQYFLVMDYVEGQDLQQVIENGLPPVDQSVRWAMQVLKTLDYIHKNDVVHRDVKPGNIKITPDNKAVLVDFGIAKAGAAMLTGIAARGAFTPCMAPPEQSRTAGKTTPASDIYSVGATLYYITTGAFPADAVARLMGHALEPLSNLNPDVGDGLSKIIEKAMALAPDDRYQDAETMTKALKTTLPRRQNRKGASRCSYNAPPAPDNIKTFRRDIRRR